MSYDEQEARKSRVVVETPTTRREVTHTEAVRGDRDGVSGATVGVIVVVAIALVTILILFLMSGQNDVANDNLALQQQPVQPSTTIVQQPAAQQPPVIIQQAPPATQQAPIIVTQPAAGGTTSGPDDSTIQSEVDKRILDDPNLSTLGVTVSVIGGKATLIGSVKSETIKSQFERLVRAVKGVKDIDNQIIVSG
ncbi:MAG: BON domain-containing protein [Acidobacteriota bacterium]|nr:BON domain-containing protein [Acidobacteriota bacterium]